MAFPSIKQTVRDIKSLKIQGAEAVSREAIKALKLAVHKSKAKTPERFISEISKIRDLFASAKPSDPFVRNAINSAFYNAKGSNLRELKENLFSSLQKALSEMQHSEQMISEIGAKKIKPGMIVFTYSYSSSVMSTLFLAKKHGIKFEVHNTETRPRMHGRLTAEELTENGIKVRHYVDSAARLAMKKVDIMLIGADAITSEGGIINRVGSELLAEIAHKQGVPVYVCTNSWKFDPKTIFGFTEEIKPGPGDEVWKNPPKNVEIDNHAFEIISPDLVTGVITELGIYEPHIIVEEIKSAYPWMIKK